MHERATITDFAHMRARGERSASISIAGGSSLLFWESEKMADPYLSAEMPSVAALFNETSLTIITGEKNYK
jgi:hypothetical protein